MQFLWSHCATLQILEWLSQDLTSRIASPAPASCRRSCRRTKGDAACPPAPRCVSRGPGQSSASGSLAGDVPAAGTEAAPSPAPFLSPEASVIFPTLLPAPRVVSGHIPAPTPTRRPGQERPILTHSSGSGSAPLPPLPALGRPWPPRSLWRPLGIFSGVPFSWPWLARAGSPLSAALGLSRHQQLAQPNSTRSRSCLPRATAKWQLGLLPRAGRPRWPTLTSQWRL